MTNTPKRGRPRKRPPTITTYDASPPLNMPKKVMVSLDQSAMDKADRDAKRHRLSRSAMIRLAIMAYRPPTDPSKEAGPQ
jgi:hypothetical protein